MHADLVIPTQSVYPQKSAISYLEMCLSDSDCSTNTSFRICNLEIYQCQQVEQAESEVKEQIITASTVGTALIATSTAFAAPLVAINPTLIYKLLSLFRRFYYLQFFNVNLPDNLISFLKIFSVGRFQYLPNIGKIIIPDDIDVPSPENFPKAGISGLFLKTAGHILCLWIIILSVYGVLFAVDRHLSRKSNFFKRKNIFEKFRQEFVPQTWEGTVSDLYMEYSCSL